MATISVPYMTYQFIPPFGSISESTYQEAKGKLKTDPNFTLLEKDPPISEEFKDDIRLGKKYFFLMIISIVVGTLLSDKSKWLNIISFICLGIFLFCLFSSIMVWGGLSLSLISYKRYLKDKAYWYTYMEECIKKSTDYRDFRIRFYESKKIDRIIDNAIR